jgi:hypothetical protein
LADLARQSHGLSSVNSQAVLVYLHSKGSITTNEYDDAVLKLAQSGYGFIRVTEEQFFLMLDREDFQLTPPVIKLFQILDSSTTDINSACAVTAGLLYRLFLEIIPQDVRDPLGFHILNTLVKHHSKNEIESRIVASLQPRKSLLSPVQRKWLVEFWERWQSYIENVIGAK